MIMPLPAEPPYSGLCTVDELKAYMGGAAFTADKAYIAALTLSGVQQELENYCNRPVQLVQIRELLRVDNTGCVNPTIAPVVKVIKCEAIVDGMNAADFNTPVDYPIEPQVRDNLVGDDGRLLDHLHPAVGDPLIVDNGIYVGDFATAFGLPEQMYAVEYIGGYNGYVNNALKMDILRVAAREMGRNHDETLSLRGDQAQAATDPDPRPRGWTDDELKGWDRIRRRVIA